MFLSCFVAEFHRLIEKNPLPHPLLSPSSLDPRDLDLETLRPITRQSWLKVSHLLKKNNRMEQYVLEIISTYRKDGLCSCLNYCVVLWNYSARLFSKVSNHRDQLVTLVKKTMILGNIDPMHEVSREQNPEKINVSKKMYVKILNARSTVFYISDHGSQLLS